MNAYDDFVRAAVWDGPLDDAEAIRAAYPKIAHTNIVTAAILGDDASVRAFLAADPALATAKASPLGWDPLTYLCFSKYLRFDLSKTGAFVRAATALLDAGASANTGFFNSEHRPEPEWESAIYGAAGVVHNAELTRLLLERGADPNDEETPYHAPETYDNSALKVLIESGKLNEESLATVLVRKADWHDRDGLKLVLDGGADPNRMTRWGYTALGQALRRDNHRSNIELLLDRGAIPAAQHFQIAAHRGRGDVLELFERRGIDAGLTENDRLLADCARGIAPHRVPAGGSAALAEFAGNGNIEGVRLLLEAGITVDARYAGDPYWDIAENSTALHVAAWRARHSTVKLLIERGVSVNATDGKGRTPLMLAVRACVDSYWTDLRSAESVEALLAAGASAEGVKLPCGYADVDRLLALRHQPPDDPQSEHPESQ